jgi:hypothetical protein
MNSGMLKIINSSQYTDANNYPSGSITRIRGGGGDTTLNLYSTDPQIVLTLGFSFTRIMQISIVNRSTGSFVVSRIKVDNTWSGWV